MREFGAIFQVVLPVFLVLAAGFCVRRLDWLSVRADVSLLRLTVNALIPCLVVDSVLGNPAAAVPNNLLVAPLMGFGTVALGVVAGMLTAKTWRAESRTTRNTFAFTVAIYNYGYLPIPLALSLFDQSTVAVLFVHNWGVELALWLLGLPLLTGLDPRRQWHKLFSPPLVAIVLAVLLTLSGGDRFVPAFARQTAHLLGQCAIPLGMLLIGATLADQVHGLKWAEGLRVMSCAVVLRLGVLPVVFLTLIWLLPLTPELRRVVILQAAMPAAVFPIVMARHYGGDVVTAIRVVVSTTLLSLITMPVWIQLGLKWLSP